MSAHCSRRAFVQACLLGVASAAIPLHIAHAMTSVEDASGNDLMRRLRFRIDFQNPLARSLLGQKFWFYLPLKSETQLLQSIKVSMVHRIQTDSLGHQILELFFDEVPRYFQMTVTLEVGIRFNQGQPSVALLENSDWLRSERLMEASSVQIAALAQQLRRGSDSQTLEAIYRWVSENIEYAGFIPEDLGALYALENRRGDCTEYAYLVAALARANSIPARVIGGYFADHDTAPKPQDYHNWAEVFVDGRWSIVDAQKGYLYPSPGRYVAFRIHHQTPINDVGAAHRYRVGGQLQVGF